ncbi:molybdopterin-dependent oxidoreductase [Mucilaginibacter agri]|uniref:Molybdopterin-dependent oxidoreductase n=1 Tax=Mucilaginibacter agri TaxID=2695265 RepID=A0A965ZGU4_9SPHI|nr:molybdopterin-dependent oxidoreductase [Mucilaginibacter agri]NCD69837.1 molybdopterin-dependent oxidoreductase [Mucilaginibacter agri]
MPKPNKIDTKRFTEGELADNKTINRRTFLSFLTFGVSGVAAFFGWKALYNDPIEPKGITGGARKALRNVLNANEQVFNKTLPAGHMAKTYPLSVAAKVPRVNGDIGLKGTDANNWIEVITSPGNILKVTLDDLKSLPKTEHVIDFKCVEGWDQIMHWGGVKFSDFMMHYQLDKQAAMEYVGLHTPDNKYYVGIDMASAMHPQTLLCYEMNGKPLSQDHGYPLRLIIPVKYGIKNLKRIGTLYFSNQRPPDYWAENGYDYYAGL